MPDKARIGSGTRQKQSRVEEVEKEKGLAGSSCPRPNYPLSAELSRWLPWFVRASCPEAREGGFVEHELWALSQGAVLRRMECRNALGKLRIGLQPRCRRVCFRVVDSRSLCSCGVLKLEKVDCSAQRLTFPAGT